MIIDKRDMTQYKRINHSDGIIILNIYNPTTCTRMYSLTLPKLQIQIEKFTTVVKVFSRPPLVINRSVKQKTQPGYSRTQEHHPSTGSN